MIKNILFDFGGVVVFLCRDRAVKAFERMGLADAEQILDKYQQKGIFLALEEGRMTEEEHRRKLGEMCGRELTFEEVQAAWMAFITGVDAELLDMLKTLRGKYGLYVLSNTNPYVMHWACSDAFSPEGLPVTEYFDGLFLSYKVGTTKPDPVIFRHVFSEAGIKAEETLFVDDGAANLDAAARLGLHTLLADPDTPWKEKMLEIIR